MFCILYTADLRGLQTVLLAADEDLHAKASCSQVVADSATYLPTRFCSRTSHSYKEKYSIVFAIVRLTQLQLKSSQLATILISIFLLGLATSSTPVSPHPSPLSPPPHQFHPTQPTLTSSTSVSPHPSLRLGSFWRKLARIALQLSDMFFGNFTSA